MIRSNASLLFTPVMELESGRDGSVFTLPIENVRWALYAAIVFRSGIAANRSTRPNPARRYPSTVLNHIAKFRSVARTPRMTRKVPERSPLDGPAIRSCLEREWRRTAASTKTETGGNRLHWALLLSCRSAFALERLHRYQGFLLLLILPDIGYGMRYVFDGAANLNAAGAHLARYAARSSPIIKDELEALRSTVTEIGVRELRQRTPVLTGELAGSTRGDAVVVRETMSLIVRLRQPARALRRGRRSGAEYWKFVVFGTARMRGNDYPQRARGPIQVGIHMAIREWGREVRHRIKSVR